MSYLTDQAQSRINAILDEAVAGLPTSGPVSFAKAGADARLNHARTQLKALASANGYGHLVDDIDEVFASFTARYGYLPDPIETNADELATVKAGLAAELVALLTPTTEEFEESVVDEIHGDDVEDVSDTEDGFDPWDYITDPAEGDYGDYAQVLDLSELVDAVFGKPTTPVVEPAPSATIEANLWGVHAVLTVQGAGAEIEFDGRNLLVSL